MDGLDSLDALDGCGGSFLDLARREVVVKALLARVRRLAARKM